MPLHVWLPGAHAAAPSHVSALMSGVLIKMGIYGLVRHRLAVAAAAGAGGASTLLALGAVSGVLGVAFAIGQHDLKRLLAYHSIENIGIIVMGVGLAMLGRDAARGRTLVVLGLAGGAAARVEPRAVQEPAVLRARGAVVHACHTREIDRLGGLWRGACRGSSAFFLLGAVAICGLPPLNGFVSELLHLPRAVRRRALAGRAALAAARRWRRRRWR